mmetsp:Transcript_29824/g.30257  ORF Transcript_29824/g.30257 Transcript_29824/m.30257 type:complete len:90 (-) Transcript_29824:131-400(-)|eukprot:CAMPEP_0182422258 /NCGR_PEP_ID=MMETSP1167-20130531/7895_1 /TAXON_ID=2988 /ORGANISM="Mallomonas Sp, Strain CCMP3275" /LENGTH=89 /DNA_ID=CAMNT_0024600155 /DNA_START=73 /DNA_END=342 /DNA_ORIENTATION=-
MFALASRIPQKFVRQQVRQFSLPTTLYNNVWRKSNIFYITYVVMGCVVVEMVYGSLTNSIWNSYNSGKLYHQIDWSKFKSEDEEEDEEE